MPEIPLTSLDVRQQQLVENAREALAQGNADYVLAICGPLLRQYPACLPLRRLLRAAQLIRYHEKNSLLAKAGGVLSRAPFLLSARPQGADALRERADQLLAADPTSVTALKLLAGAAARLGWSGTAVFAREAIRELSPDDEANLIALGEAQLEAGNPAGALLIADEILHRHPADADGQDLMRKAAIAQAVDKGHWDQPGDYRAKLKP